MLLQLNTLSKNELWNGISGNYMDQFWWYWQKYSDGNRNL